MKKRDFRTSKMYEVMQAIIDYVKANGRPIFYLTLARQVGLLPKTLFSLLRRIGEYAIETRQPFLDIWVGYEESGLPAVECFLQKVEAGYLKEGDDWLKFLEIERKKFSENID